MEMTIDRAIKKLKGQQADFNEQYIDFGGINDAFYTAYEIMRKYQTMQEVLEKVWNVPSCMLDEADCLNKIMETYRTVR